MPCLKAEVRGVLLPLQVPPHCTNTTATCAGTVFCHPALGTLTWISHMDKCPRMFSSIPATAVPQRVLQSPVSTRIELKTVQNPASNWPMPGSEGRRAPSTYRHSGNWLKDDILTSLVSAAAAFPEQPAAPWERKGESQLGGCILERPSS